jgi:hypothetical protein
MGKAKNDFNRVAGLAGTRVDGTKTPERAGPPPPPDLDQAKTAALERGAKIHKAATTPTKPDKGPAPGL